jgi:hypothetical protein
LEEGGDGTARGMPAGRLPPCGLLDPTWCWWLVHLAITLAAVSESKYRCMVSNKHAEQKAQYRGGLGLTDIRIIYVLGSVGV